MRLKADGLNKEGSKESISESLKRADDFEDVQEVADRIYEKMAEGRSGGGGRVAEDLRLVGHKLYKLAESPEQQQHVKREFAKIMKLDEATDHERVDATRMMLQITALGGGSFEEADRLLGQLRNIFEETTDKRLRSRKAVYLSNARDLAAFAAQQAGKYEKSVALRDKVLEANNKMVSEKTRQSMLLENARDLKKSNLNAESVEYYDRLLKLYPEYGRESGKIVNLLRERAEAHGYAPGSEQELALLEDIWNDPEFKNYSQIFSIGLGLRNAYGPDEGQKIADLLEEFVGRIERHLEGKYAQGETRANLEKYYLDAIVDLAHTQASLGNEERAKELYDKYLAESVALGREGMDARLAGIVERIDPGNRRRGVFVLILAFFGVSSGLIWLAIRQKRIK